MSWVNAGYDGTVSEQQWAAMSRLLGSDYAVAGPTDFKPTVAVADRTVQVLAGTAMGFGVLSTSDSTVNVQCATITSGTRWDTIAIRRNWTGTGGTTSLVAISGSSAQAVTKTYSTPGTQDDQPIALARLVGGSTAVQELIDLRYPSSKVFTATNLLALPNASWGTEAKVGNIRYRRELDGSGNLAWVKDSSILGGTTANELVGSACVAPMAGWQFQGTNINSRALTLGNWVQLDLQARTSDDMNPNNDTKIGTLVPQLCPDTLVRVDGLYYNIGRGTYDVALTINPDGEIYTRNGETGQNLAGTAVGTIGLYVSGRYMRKVA